MKKIKHPKCTKKLTEFDKAIYVYDEIVTQSKEYGTRIPIKVIVREFSKDEKYAFFVIPEKEVIKIISRIENNGTIEFTKKGCVGRILP